MSLPAKVRSIKPAATDLYHGIPVLDIHVGDPIPTPRAPERYAVRVYPDLARYLLTFNHPENRGLRARTVAKYATDMRSGLWWFTPESVVFSTTGGLQDGQHRLASVCEYGSDVWMMFDFGWPGDIITAIDRGIGRTNADALAIDGIVNAATVASAVGAHAKYREAEGTSRGYSTKVIVSAQQALSIYREDTEGWQTACRAGRRVYDVLDKSLSPSVWSAAYYAIADVDADGAAGYFAAIIDGTGAPGSATRTVADWFRRRPVSATRTGDKREPIEIIVRGFNAWKAGRSVAMPKAPGFVLSRVR